MPSTSSPAPWRRGRAGNDGLVFLTSRVSVEMVQKTAAMGAPILSPSPRRPRLRCGRRRPPTSRWPRSREATDSKFSPILSASGPEKRQSMSPDKLVYMANQIGKFFAAKAPQRRPGTADHIKILGSAHAEGES